MTTETQAPEGAPAAAIQPLPQPEFDALMDHIYEHGTMAEGITARARAMCEAYARAALAAQPGTVQWCTKCGEGVMPGMCRRKDQPDPDADVRELRKWLNEEPNRPLDRAALARVLTALAAHPATVNPDLTVAAPAEGDAPGEFDWLDLPGAVAAWNRIRRAARALSPTGSIAETLNAAAALADLAFNVQPKHTAEPVAVRYDFDGYGWKYIDNGSGSDWMTRHPDGELLYDSPCAAPAHKLTDEQINAAAEEIDTEPAFVAGYWHGYKAAAQAPAPAPVPAENLPTKEHIRELAQEALDQIMEQAQVFASAWSLIGGRFDYGNALSEAHDAKDELRTMVRSLADLAAETVRPVPCAAVGDVRDTDKQLMEFYGVESLSGLIDAQEEHVRRLQAKLPPLQQPAFTRVREG